VTVRRPVVVRGIDRKTVSVMAYDRFCHEIVAQTRQIASLLERRDEPADARAALASCPGWNAGQLLRHLGGVQRWAEEVVRTRAVGPVPDDDHGALVDYADEDLRVVVPWLVESAALLAYTLREAGPDVAVWTPVPNGTTTFYARRFTHETLLHRADVSLALAGTFTAEPPVVIDALDEWMELGSLPLHLDRDPRVRELLGPGRTLRLHASDVRNAETDWLVDMTGDVITWRRSGEPAAVTVEVPLTRLLLLVYRRLTPAAAGATISGDENLFDFWLERVGFG
jgi:uncharacterized protein (TIGR03083 family)